MLGSRITTVMATYIWIDKMRLWSSVPLRDSVAFSKKYIRIISTSNRFLRLNSTNVQTNESEYSETAEYPPCFDPSLLGRKRLKRQEWYDHIQRLPTVEEKLLALCSRKDYATKVHICTPFLKSFNVLPLTLHCTRTHLIEDMPDHHKRINVDALVEYIKPMVIKNIQDVFIDMTNVEPTKVDFLTEKKRQQIRGQLMTDRIFRLVASLLSNSLPHLRNCQVDYHPRLEAFWWAGDFPPTLMVKNRRKNAKFGSILPVDHPIDFYFQYIGKPYMQIRNADPLEPFLNREDNLCCTNKVKKYCYDPTTAGLPFRTRYATSVPGFWPADSCGFGTLSIHTREDSLFLTQLYGENSLSSTLHNAGVLSSFAWLLGLAYYKGFSPFQEVTYPFTTQTVITNGQCWSFYAYQLNTICLSQDVSRDSVQNVCWATSELKLFDIVEDGQVKGFNNNVLKHLVKFIINPPKKLEGVNLTPYLNAVHHPDETWVSINKNWKDKYANRPGVHKHKELNLWEKIYKIKFNAKIE